MKTNIWDILTGVTLLGILCLVIGFAALLINNAGATTPPPVVQPIATIALPTATNTFPVMPPTWTPQPTQTRVLPELRPTWTMAPTDTPVVLPTFTASPRATLRPSGSSGFCRVIFQSPVDGSTQDRNKTFQMRWTLQNTGTTDWKTGETDIRYVSGDKLQTGSDLIDLPYDVKAGGNIDVLIDMRTPSSSGTVRSNWSIIQAGKSVCRFYVELQIK